MGLLPHIQPRIQYTELLAECQIYHGHDILP